MIVFTCGGTGGHISPALNLAESLKSKGIKAHFIGGNRLEKNMIIGYPFTQVPCSSKNLLIVFNGILAALKILKELKPTCVFSTGGYVTLPVGIATILLRIPLVLLEQNSIMGRTNKLLGNFAKIIFLGFPEVKNYQHKSLFSGNPLSPSIQKNTNSSNQILITGGSQGSQALNNLIFDSLAELAELNQNIYWVCGEKNFLNLQEKLQQKCIYEHENSYKYQSITIKLEAFINTMHQELQRSKVVISRAGAMSIAEIIGFNIPSLLIPYPFAKDNHQTYNALHLSRNEAAITIKEKNIDTHTLIKSLKILIKNYTFYKNNLLGLQTQANDIIIDELTKKRLI